MGIVKVMSLQVDYDEVQAVSDLSFELEPGRIYGFLGPNGSGKTSTIKVLAGVLEPTQGTIVLNGHCLETARELALLKVGYMPDFAPVYENLKVWEYLDVFAAAYGMPASGRPAHLDRWLEKVDLMSKKDAVIRGLSRGMLQRLVFARTLLSSPDIILLDEPASGLDPIARKRMRDILHECRANGACVLISSHILSELSDLVDSLIILEKGKMVISGTLAEIRTRIGSGKKVTLRFASADDDAVFQRLVEEERIAPERVRRQNGVCVVVFKEQDGQAADFLKRLMARGICPQECSVAGDDVEDIFLKIGAKEVA